MSKFEVNSKPVERKHCPYCGEDNFSFAKYCSGCGYEIPERIFQKQEYENKTVVSHRIFSLYLK